MMTSGISDGNGLESHRGGEGNDLKKDKFLLIHLFTKIEIFSVGEL